MVFSFYLKKYPYRLAYKVLKLIRKPREIVFYCPELLDWDDSGTLTYDEKVLITQSVSEVKQTMWDYVGIVRSNLRLERAERRIHNIYNESEALYKKTKVFNEILELRNLVACSHIIIKSAKARKESRGLHYTIDYPNLFPLNKIENTIIKNIHS